VLSTGVATLDPERAARGSRGAAAAIRLRAIATALGVVMVSVSVTSVRPSDGLVAMVKYSAVAAAAFNALAFGWFALAMLRTERSALHGLWSNYAAGRA